MPLDHRTVTRRFYKELVVPQSDWPAQKLLSDANDRWQEHQVMKARSDAPCAQRVEKNGLAVACFVSMKLVEALIVGLRFVHQVIEFLAKHRDLGRRENPYPRQKTLLFEVGNLRRRKACVRSETGRLERGRYGLVNC